MYFLGKVDSERSLLKVGMRSITFLTVLPGATALIGNYRGRHVDTWGLQQGGLAHLPMNLFVYISVCTPCGGSKLTPKVPILIAEIVQFDEFSP